MDDVLERRLTITAARDCHDGCVFDSPTCKPGSGGSHGVHGSELRMYVIGPRGATQFVLYTNWMWPETTKRSEESFGPSRWGTLGQNARSYFGPTPADPLEALRCQRSRGEPPGFAGPGARRSPGIAGSGSRFPEGGRVG